MQKYTVQIVTITVTSHLVKGSDGRGTAINNRRGQTIIVHTLSRLCNHPNDAGSKKEKSFKWELIDESRVGETGGL